MKSYLKRVGSFVLLAVSACFAEAGWRSGYYEAASGKSGTNLLAALHGIVSTGTTNIPYSSTTRFDTSDALKWIDENPANTNEVILIYSGLTAPKSAFGVTTGWSREHCWPNSYGLDDVEPSFSDLHNLRAIDWNVNSSRNNKVYDESSGSVASPAHPEAPGCTADPDSWQPADWCVGDVARSVLYMAVRYRGDRAGEPRLDLTESVSAATTATNYMAKLSTLLYWHALDPVSDVERLRNDRVESLQGNRNPFVDHPEFVPGTWGDITGLSMSVSNQTATLSWNNALRRAVVEWSTNVTGPRFEIVPTTNRVSVTMTNGTGFFRLRMK